MWDISAELHDIIQNCMIENFEKICPNCET